MYFDYISLIHGDLVTTTQIFERGRNQPANRKFSCLFFLVNLIDCKVRVLPCLVIPYREYMFFADHGVHN